jgi:hypothetical protein
MRNEICTFQRRGAFLLAFIMSAVTVSANEEAKYTIVERDGAFEVRDYEPQVLAEVRVDNFDDGGGKGFRILFDYISGANRSREKIAMTAPVAQEPANEKIPMTVPVHQERGEEGWRFSFMMPASYTMDNAPEPENPAVKLREIPARRVAAMRYSGRWTESGFLRHKSELEAWMKEKELAPAGEAIWARYNPPWTLWFLRRNEVLIPVD